MNLPLARLLSSTKIMSSTSSGIHRSYSNNTSTNKNDSLIRYGATAWSLETKFFMAVLIIVCTMWGVHVLQREPLPPASLQPLSLPSSVKRDTLEASSRHRATLKISRTNSSNVPKDQPTSVNIDIPAIDIAGLLRNGLEGFNPETDTMDILHSNTTPDGYTRYSLRVTKTRSSGKKEISYVSKRLKTSMVANKSDVSGKADGGIRLQEQHGPQILSDKTLRARTFGSIHHKPLNKVHSKSGSLGKSSATTNTEKPDDDIDDFP